MKNPLNEGKGFTHCGFDAINPGGALYSAPQYHLPHFAMKQQRRSIQFRDLLVRSKTVLGHWKSVFILLAVSLWSTLLLVLALMRWTARQLIPVPQPVSQYPRPKPSTGLNVRPIEGVALAFTLVFVLANLW